MAEKEMALSGKQKEMILMSVEKRKRQEVQVPCEEISKRKKETSLLAEEEVERKRKEREIYLELRQKAIDNPLSDVPFFPFGPGCVMPDFAEKGETVNYFELKRQRPLTEEEERRFTPGMSVNLPSLPPLPWDKRQFVPLTPEIIQKLEEQRQLTHSTTLASREGKRQKLAAEGRCLDGSYLTSYCKCDGASLSQSFGLETLYSPELSQIYLAYRRQIRQSHCFDIDNHTGSPWAASVLPFGNFRGTIDLLMELANSAILEYNEKESNVFTPGMPVNLPSPPLLPWDKRQFVPLTPEIIQKLEEQEQLAQSSNLASREEKREKLAAQEKCLDGSYLTPYCNCDDALGLPSFGFETLYSPKFSQICLAYRRQTRQSHCFDIDDHTDSPWGASVLPLKPFGNFRGTADLLMELANIAILEYNEKEGNVFKYKILKIEKVNYSAATYYQYWMTVKVLNLTLVTPIETFQIHAGMSTIDANDKLIYCCRPKEEVLEISNNNNNGYKSPAAVAAAFEAENGFNYEEGHSSESVTNPCNSTGPPPQDDDSSDTSLKLGLPYSG